MSVIITAIDGVYERLLGTDWQLASCPLSRPQTASANSPQKKTGQKKNGVKTGLMRVHLPVSHPWPGISPTNANMSAGWRARVTRRIQERRCHVDKLTICKQGPASVVFTLGAQTLSWGIYSGRRNTTVKQRWAIKFLSPLRFSQHVWDEDIWVASCFCRSVDQPNTVVNSNVFEPHYSTLLGLVCCCDSIVMIIQNHYCALIIGY